MIVDPGSRLDGFFTRIFMLLLSNSQLGVLGIIAMLFLCSRGAKCSVWFQWNREIN
jgi:hypothetical protein